MAHQSATPRARSTPRPTRFFRVVLDARWMLLVPVLLQTGTQTCNADPPIFASIPSWSGPIERTQSIALGDIDGDGKLDLVRGNSRGESTLYLNTGVTFASAPAWRGPEE